MGPLVAIGGVMVSQLVLDALQDDIEAVCRKAGFPDDEPFKWSAGPGLWMRDKLKYGAREKFFRSVLQSAGNRGVTAQVIIKDENFRTATGAATHDLVRVRSSSMPWTRQVLRLWRLHGYCGL